MKALPMLDHVMLWLARTWAVYLLLFYFAFSTRAFLVYGDGFLKAFWCPLAAFVWLVCLWSLRHGSARIYLGTFSLLCLVRLVTSIVSILGRADNIDVYILNLLGVCGFLAVIWIAIRPPRNLVTSSKVSHPLPQSS